MGTVMFAITGPGSRSLTWVLGVVAWTGTLATSSGRDWDLIAFLFLLIVALGGLAWALLARRK